MLAVIVAGVSFVIVAFLLLRSRTLSQRVQSAEQQQAMLTKHVGLLRQSQRIARTAEWVWTVESDVIEWSDEIFEMLGYEPGSFKLDREFYISRIDPDDRDEFESAMTQLLEKNAVSSIEYRISSSTNETLWIEQHAELCQGAAGGEKYVVGVCKDISQRKITEENLKYLAHHDGLTGLANRNYFVDQLRKTFALARRQHNHGALLFFDCDHFKAINDSLGHQVGDKILKLIGERLTSNIRVEDEAARLGGDEFVVMLVNLGRDQRIAAERAQSIAEKLKDLLLIPYELDGDFHHLTPSIGVSLFPQEGQTADDAMKHADTAMYRAKDAGRNTVRFFMPSMQEEVEQRLRTQTELRRAIINDELELHYQPQISATEGVTGVEALIRWNHPERGMVFPGDFIEIAEESGLIIPMGEWVLKNGLEQLKRWQAEGLELGVLAINVSPKQFHQGGFVEYVKGLLNHMQMSGDALELELTENVLLNQTAETVSKMEALKEVGVLFSIDDFGTGYSSMAYLKQLPLDRLKIDKSFVSDITTDINDAHIVKTIIGMAHNLGLELIAEGVETREEMDFLLENGCYNYQGYYFSRPIATQKIVEFCNSYQPVLS